MLLIALVVLAIAVSAWFSGEAFLFGRADNDPFKREVKPVEGQMAAWGGTFYFAISLYLFAAFCVPVDHWWDRWRPLACNLATILGVIAALAYAFARLTFQSGLTGADP